MGQKLGQHFLTRPEIAGWVADSVGMLEEEVVLEIGPGHGILTRELLHRAKKVIAIEKDMTLIGELKNTFKEDLASGKLILIEEDVRDFEPKKCNPLDAGYTLLANIPYYITGRIIRQFLTTPHQPKNIAILIQKEVAVRIVARDNKNSLLSLSVHAFGTPKLEKIVKAGAFSPQPKVDSAILSIKNISRDRFMRTGVEESTFFELIHSAFSQKRKTLGSTLRNIVPENTFTLCTVDKKTRPEDVSLDEWFCLAQNL